jgi:hypothetical protein
MSNGPDGEPVGGVELAARSSRAALARAAIVGP